MLTHIKDSFYWASAVQNYRSGNFQKALSRLDSVSGKRKYYSEYFAFLATLHLILDLDGSRKLLVKAMKFSVPKKSAYRHYIDLYCSYYLSILDGNEEDRKAYHALALRASAPSIIREWLPLP